MSVKIKFLGAAGTVTGSKYLIDSGATKILVDCGMFQGSRAWREKNWDSPPVDLSTIDAVLLTHAHLDHSGMLPRFYKLGLKCPIYCTAATLDLSKLILTDSGRLQQEETNYRVEHGLTRHAEPQPLYTEEDANQVLSLFQVVSFDQEHKISDGVFAEWRHMGHILGAASIRLKIANREIVFSGDIGRYGVPILKDPVPQRFADLLLIEGTYGNKSHGKEDPKEKLAEIIRRTVQRRGMLLIPSFAVGRTQSILYDLRILKEKGEIPDVPIVVDSPMARDATSIYRKHPLDYDEGALEILKSGREPFTTSKLYFVQSRDESKKLNGIDDPFICISASGMLTGGRILHHLKNRISDSRNTILFVGYQPEGGRGAWIQSGAPSLTVLHEQVEIRAEVVSISGLSAHGDRDELLRWCGESSGKPNKVAVVHAEPDSARSFKSSLEQKLGWDTAIPSYLDEWEV